MYCKNCGRQLKEGMRFCDRCGQSVRKNTKSVQATRRQEIEDLKNERLNRKKRLEEKEARQARNKKRRKSGSNGFAFAVIVLLIAVVSVIIGYNIFSGGSDSSSVSETAGVTSSPTASQSADVSKNGYAEITVGSVTCYYPAAFHSNTTSGNEKLNLTDAFGGATMVVSQEAKTGEAKDLMAEYAARHSEVSYSRAGSDWYAITLTDEGVVTHRKCVVRSGLAVYYDFSYNADSSSAKKYTEYIEYMDENFK